MTICNYCGLENEGESRECGRCGALLPKNGQPKVDIDKDEAECPSCSAINTTSAEYCTACGTPMAVITRVLELVNHNERGALETWRVFGIETQMVARAREMEQLHRLHEETSENHHARWLAIEARTGLGKSRLIAEFSRDLDRNFSEAVLVPVECREVTGGPFNMFSRWFKKRFYISEQDPVAVARRKLVEAVEALLGKERAEEVGQISSMIGHMMGFPMGEDIGEDEEGAEDKLKESVGLFDRRRFDAVAELLRADAERNPLIMALEDLQYATDQSLRLLSFLQRNLQDSPILFVLTWNPDELYADKFLGEIPFHESLELEPLTDEEVDAFVTQTLHKLEDLPQLMIDKIVESAHGNPLAVEEMMRLLISEGTIDTRQEPWSVDHARIKKLKLPQTVDAAVKARIEALSEPERELLRMASCVGDVFWADLAVCIWRLSADMNGTASPHGWRKEVTVSRVMALLESLERKDIIRRREDSLLPGQEEFFFKHRLERRTIYNALVSHRKQRYHRLVAQWVENKIPGGKRGPLTEYIAQHYDHARSLEHAARRYIEAAEWARKRYSNRKAIELYTRGLAYLSDADVELKVRAFHDLGSVHDHLGEFDQSLAYYRELHRYAWLIDDRSKGGVALNKIGRAYRSLGEFDEALECLDEALEHFHHADDLVGIASTLDDIGKIHWIRGRYDDALRYYTSALSLRREVGDKRSIALSLNHIGSLHLQRGELRDAMIYFREALELRREVDDRQGLAESFNNLGILCMERADYPQARTLLEEALEIVREIGYRALEGIILNNLGETLSKMSEQDGASAMLEEALEVAEESGEKRLIFDILRNMGQVALEQGNRRDALEHMDEALEVAREIDSPVLVGIGMQNMADIHARHIFDMSLRDESVEQAEHHYREAIEVFTEVGNESQLGRCLSSYGHFLAERGELVKGKQTLEQAQEIFKRLEMQKLWDATEKLLGEL
jgi:tetratricopeptide (TPR) repeat protein